MRLYGFFIASIVLLVCFSRSAAALQADVRVVSDEARAVLSVLEKRKTGREISASDWQKIFDSEGYRRLKKRELSLNRPFEDGEFKRFVLSDELLQKYDRLKTTLERWEKASVETAAGAALRYLPETASIRAKIYPVIKPRDNSFVFEVREDPAIFLYLDPQVTREQFENTLAHELHHIGFGTACPAADASAEIEKLSREKQAVFRWTGAFGEGFAMLAAAGGPDTHPHRFSKPEDRARWDADVENFNADLKRTEKFFRDVLEKRLEGDKITETAFSFYGVQGPWYTVGWKMSAVIEKAFGREKLIEAFCDQRRLLPLYNEAAARYNRENEDRLETFSGELIDALK